MFKFAYPELTAVTMGVRTRSTWPTVSSEMVSATDRDVLVKVVSALCFDHLVSRRLCLLWCVKDCASTLEKYESLSTGDRTRVASIASPALTFKPRNLQFDTSAWCGHPDACSGNFGQKYFMEATEVTRLLHGFYVDESSARYV